MNGDQRRRRIALWIGSLPVIAAFVLLSLVLLLNDCASQAAPQIPDGSDLIRQANQSPEVMAQAIERIPAESP